MEREMVHATVLWMVLSTERGSGLVMAHGLGPSTVLVTEPLMVLSTVP